MQQISDWLQKLGLGQYAQEFSENDIDFDVLPDLTDQDLRELGITSLGHRRRLLRAIADLGDTQPRAQAPSVPEAPVASQETLVRPSAPGLSSMGAGSKCPVCSRGV